MRTIKVAPSATKLIESVRDIGYTLSTALADVIDNSVSAGASTIQLFTHIDDQGPRLGILDDGCGMPENVLHDAMRLGSVNPRDSRNQSDLGRFGLGLKTASFSQCRRLTVVTRWQGKTSAAIWDLDLVARENEWLVQIPDDLDGISWTDLLGNQGTLVIWDCIDRLTEGKDSATDSEQFNRALASALDHLELVFHRFLAGEPGIRKIDIRLNNRALEAFDPFCSHHPATNAEPQEIISVHDYQVWIQAFTLPHHSKVSKEEWEYYAGPEGYLKNQGFYIYRARRLIIHGTWFGLARQQELTKLSRVRVDMPNNLDEEWKIDVRKSSARPPHVVRQRLKRVIERIVKGSKRTYTVRGRRLVSKDQLPVWDRLQNKNEISYRINPSHPVLADFSSRLLGRLQNDFVRVLELCGSALPMETIYADLGSRPNEVTNSLMSDEALFYTVETTVKHLADAGIESSEIIEMLQVAEPFRSNWGRLAMYLEQVLTGATKNG